MTKEEVTMVLEIMMTADNGCVYCAENLARKFQDRFPEHADVVEKVMNLPKDQA